MTLGDEVKRVERPREALLTRLQPSLVATKYYRGILLVYWACLQCWSGKITFGLSRVL